MSRFAMMQEPLRPLQPLLALSSPFLHLRYASRKWMLRGFQRNAVLSSRNCPAPLAFSQEMTNAP